jgi:23S rRNA pseudouridine955/2504/2580 synthase
MAANDTRGARGRMPPKGKSAPRTSPSQATAGQAKRAAPVAKPRSSAGNDLRAGPGSGGSPGKSGARPKPGLSAGGRAGSGNQSRAAARISARSAREAAAPDVIEARPRRFTVKPGQALQGMRKAPAERLGKAPAGHARPDPVAPPPKPAEPAVSAGVRAVVVAEDRDGQRLDNFLLGQLKGAPRSLVYKLVRSGQVRINGKRAKADSRVSGGDEIRIPPVRLAEAGESRPPPESMLRRLADSIVFEDRNLLALNKPSGIAVHGGSGISVGVIEALRAMRPDEDFELVHRLDRDTSGVLIIAKRRAALLELQALLREGDDEEAPNKKYLALLVGKMPSGTMTVEAPLQKSVLQGGERMVRVDPAGKPSVSHFRLIERRGGHSFCEVRIETGRTHQIRVHAAHLGHPVAGDEKYGDREANKKLAEQAGLKRLFLHAASMEFALDSGRTPYLINAPLAPELTDVLDRLG